VGVHSCGHFQDVSIECNLGKRGVCVAGDVRLAGSPRNSSGRVEVCFGSWGTVCGDGWDDADASVVCRMLNYSGNAIGVTNAYFGQGISPISVGNVRCTGGEYSMFSCPHVTDPDDCSHRKDAGVICSGIFLSVFTNKKFTVKKIIRTTIDKQ
jgi:deleted-in-malignant-brain-tumors protein 1